MDEALESKKERAGARSRRSTPRTPPGSLDDAGWHAAMASLVVPAYLDAVTAEAGSGHSGTPEEWEYSRGIVAEAV